MTEINTDDEIEKKMKSVTFQDTPKIPIRQPKYNFVLIDSFTDTIIGCYDSNRQANEKIHELVKNDLEYLILHFRTLILTNKNVAENRDTLNKLKHSLYQLRTLDQSKNYNLYIDDKLVSRYMIKTTNDMNDTEDNWTLL